MWPYGIEGLTSHWVGRFMTPQVMYLVHGIGPRIGPVGRVIGPLVINGRGLQSGKKEV